MHTAKVIKSYDNAAKSSFIPSVISPVFSPDAVSIEVKTFFSVDMFKFELKLRIPIAFLSSPVPDGRPAAMSLNPILFNLLIELAKSPLIPYRTLPESISKFDLSVRDVVDNTLAESLSDIKLTK